MSHETPGRVRVLVDVNHDVAVLGFNLTVAEAFAVRDALAAAMPRIAGPCEIVRDPVT